MTSSEDNASYDPRIGLCSNCQFARPLKHPQGGTPYYKCELAANNVQFDKFPRLPILQCPGHRPPQDNHSTHHP